MRLRDTLGEAWWAAKAYRVRVAALMLSLAIGIGAVTFGANILEEFSRDIERLAFGSYRHALVVRENNLIADRDGPPRLADARLLVETLQPRPDSAAWFRSSAQAWTSGKMALFDVFGVAGRYEDELDSAVALGRLLSRDETAGFDRVCLVGSGLARTLELDSVPKRITIRGVDCEVVGVLAAPRSRPAEKFANAVIAPLQPAQRYFSLPDSTAPGELTWMTLFMPVGSDMRAGEIETDMALRAIRGVPQSRPSPFLYGDPNATLEQQMQQRKLVSQLLTAVASLTLAASLTGYVAIAAAVVNARKREIALRMAMGAESRDIRLQLIAEFAGYGLGAGLAGWLLGIGFSVGLAAAADWPLAMEWTSAPKGIVLALGAGLAVGSILASKISSISPSLAAKA